MLHTLLLGLKDTKQKHFLFKNDWKRIISVPAPDFDDKDAVNLFFMKYKNIIPFFEDEIPPRNIARSLDKYEIESIELFSISEDALHPKFESCPNCHSKKVGAKKVLELEDVYDFGVNGNTSNLVYKNNFDCTENDFRVVSYRCLNCNLNLDFFNFDDLIKSKNKKGEK